MTDDQPRAGEGALVRALGVRALAANTINVIIGGGIFVLPALAAAGMGSRAPVAYLVGALAMGLVVLCFAEAGSRVSLTGGPYAYVEVAFGPFAGYLVGVLLWLTGTVAFAAVATIFADNAARLVPALEGRGGRTALLVAVLLALTAANVVGVRQGARVNAVSAAVKLVPLLLLV